jgi:HPt (histidine-containing phosphotransfer) domain-containing protein
MAVFLADVPKMMKRLRKAARAGDLPEIAAAAHAIKGSAGLFSQGAVFEGARRLERMASSGEREGLDATLADVETAMTALVRELRGIV